MRSCVCKSLSWEQQPETKIKASPAGARSGFPASSAHIYPRVSRPQSHQAGYLLGVQGFDGRQLTTPLPLFLTETLKSSSHQRPSRWTKWKRVGSPSPGAHPKARLPGRCWMGMRSPTPLLTAPSAAPTLWTRAAPPTSSEPWGPAGPTTSPSSRSSATPTIGTTSAGPWCCSPAHVSPPSVAHPRHRLGRDRQTG